MEDVTKTNILGQIYLINQITKLMIKKKFGRIINISSMSVSLNLEGTSLYTSSKACDREISKDSLRKFLIKIMSTSRLIL